MNIIMVIVFQAICFGLIAKIFYGVGHKRGVDEIVDLWIHDKIMCRYNPVPKDKLGGDTDGGDTDE